MKQSLTAVCIALLLFGASAQQGPFDDGVNGFDDGETDIARSRVARAPLVKSALAGAAIGVGASHFISKAKKKKGRVARSPLVKSALAGAAIGVGASHFISKAKKKNG